MKYLSLILLLLLACTQPPADAAEPLLVVNAPPIAAVNTPFHVTIVRAHPQGGVGFHFDPPLEASLSLHLSDVADQLTLHSPTTCICTFTIEAWESVHATRTTITTTVQIVDPSARLPLVLR